MAVRAGRPDLFLRQRSDPGDIHRICTLSLESRGRRARGVVMSIPLLPPRLLEEQELALELMLQAVSMAGPHLDAVGLGSLLAIVAGRGTALQERIPQPVTTGAASTAWAAAQNTMTVARAMELSPGEPIAILGYSGAVGGGVAGYLSANTAHPLRVEAKGPHRRRAISQGATPFGDPAQVLEDCSLVVGASTTGGKVSPRLLRPGAVLLDVAMPPTLSGPPPRGVTVLSGEALSPPRGYRRRGWGWFYHLLAGYGLGHVFACLVEPMLMALEGNAEPFSQGRSVSLESVQQVGRIATTHGFRPVLARGHGTVDPRTLRRIQHR